MKTYGKGKMVVEMVRDTYDMKAGDRLRLTEINYAVREWLNNGTAKLVRK